MSLFSTRFGQTRARLVEAGAVFAISGLLAGCGAGYRPVVTPINPSGPAPQPESLVAVVSSSSPTSPGVATVIDYSGDTILAQAPIGVGPKTFTIDSNGGTGYTINSDGTLTDFPVSNKLGSPNSVNYTTLPSTAQPISLFSPTAGLWAADLAGSGPGMGATDVLTGSPEAFKLTVPVVATPVMVIGSSLSGERNYTLSQGTVASGVACNQTPTTGSSGAAVDAIEIANYAVSATIPVGVCPVYAVQSADGQRLFVLNRGGDATNPNGSITVINTQNNAADTCAPFQNRAGQWVTCHPSIPLPAGPVYAEYVVATQQLVVANYDSSSISVIDVPLDEYGNDSNTYSGSCVTYAQCGAITGGFGTVHTIPVGVNPASVTALYDGSRAYTANQTDGTVTVVNLGSFTVEKTIPVLGHPRTVASTQNSLQGKVYVASPDSSFLTIIRTDQDIVDTTVLVPGNIVDVRVSTQNGNSGNANTVSRMPGYGQPCYLPPASLPATYALSDCRTLP